MKSPRIFEDFCQNVLASQSNVVTLPISSQMLQRAVSQHSTCRDEGSKQDDEHEHQQGFDVAQKRMKARVKRRSTSHGSLNSLRVCF